MPHKILFFCFTFGVFQSAWATPTRWEFVSGYSSAHFNVKHLLIGTVQGSFSRVEGSLLLDDDRIEQSSVHAQIFVSSLFTGLNKRDAMLKSKLFLDVSRYPTMTFHSKRVEQDSLGHTLVTGDLTLHGITREVVLDIQGPTAAVNDLKNIPTRAVTARTKIDRKDFGMIWNKPLQGGGMLIGDEVTIEIHLELVEAASKNP